MQLKEILPADVSQGAVNHFKGNPWRPKDLNLPVGSDGSEFSAPVAIINHINTQILIFIVTKISI
jgi:hypothetical protein